MRRVVWYLVVILTFLPYSALGILCEILRRIVAAFDVLQTVMFRFQHWAYRVPHDYFANSPYRRTLREVYEDSLQEKV